jgi:two-component system, sensor histidine kinase and response regulator
VHLVRDISISRKLKLVIMLTTSVALLVASAAFVAYDLIAFRQSMASDLSTLAKVIGTNSTAALAFNDRGAAKDVLSALTAKQNIVRARIYESDSDLFAEYVRDGERDDIALTVQQQSQVGFADGYLIASETIDLDGETIGTVYLISNLDVFRSRLNRYAGVVAAVLLGSLLVAFLLSSKLQSLISDPISHLAKTVRAVSVDKDYTIRAVKHGRDEMGMLIDGFNEMLGQIEERDAKLQSARDELEQRVEERTKELQDEMAERKQAVELLRRSEEHFRSLIENASDVITIIDSKGTILYESPSVERVLGRKPQTLMGENALDLTHPDDRKTAVAMLTAAAGEDRPAEPFELRFKHADGSWRTLEVIGQVVRDESGAVEVIINSRDVTERKRSEDALRESEERYRTILESIQEGYYEVDLSGRLTFFNSSLARIVGSPAERLKGLSHREYTDPETARTVFEAFNRVFSTGEPIEGLQYQITNLEGVTRFLEVSVSLRRESTGEIAGFRGTIRDITDRKQAEEAQRESEDRYRDLVEHSHDLICTHDLEGRILSANQWAARVLGYDLEAVLKMNLRDLLVPEFRSEFEQYLHAVRTQGVAEGFMKVQTITGEARVIEYTNTLRTEGVAEPIVRGMARDITERLRSEAALRESEEKYRTILESIQEGYFEVDLSGRLTFFNSSLSRLVGTPAERMKGLTHREYTDPETARRLSEVFGEVFRTGVGLEAFQYEITTLEGAHRLLESSVSLRRDSTGEIAGFRGTTRDVTERQQAEQALRESEEKYRTILQNIQEGYFEVDLTGNLTFFNDSLSRIVGSPPERLMGLNSREYTDAETSRRLYAAFNQVFRTGEPLLEFQYQIVTRDGVHKFLESSILLRRDQTGEISGFRGTLRDITERTHAEQALRESQERYKTLFESATDAIMILDTEDGRMGCILAANRAAAEHTGYTVEELMNLSVADLQTQEQAELTSNEITRIVQGEHLTLELLRRRKDGTTFPVEVNAGPLSLGGKRYILSFARDITQRKQMEKEVTMLAHAIRSIQEAVCITDAKDVLLFVNDAFLKTYGYERHEVLGKNIFELVRLPANSAHDTAAIPPPNLLRRWEGELLNRRKDGTTFPIHLSTSPIFDETGRTIALVGVTQDITESRHAIEELQKAKEAAEAASRAKSEFLANMSHEVRTPMNGIIGMTELALDTELTTEQREYLQLVKLSADSLLRVINDILDFSKIEAGKLELNFDEFSLQDSVDEVMKALAVRADQKGIELAYYLRPEVPDLIVGDAGRLRQILVNLVGNAIKFTERGEVVVRIEAESQTDDQVVLHFCVRDTGIGVSIEKQAVIFESFTQADGSTTRKYGGTGLGLAISTQLVHAMDGQIWIQSPSNCELSNADCGLENCPSDPQSTMRNLDSAIGGPGSTFHFTAAFALPRTSVARTAPLEISTLRGLPALVVDDNATNRRILELQLTGWGMIPLTAPNAAEALNAIRQAAALRVPFRLALLDLHMPDVDGLELAEQIRRMPEAADVKLIMMSSAVRENYTLQDRGIDAYLLKPVKASELLSVIRTVLATAVRSVNGSRHPRAQIALSSAHPAHVLVAEDSLVNQELIKRLLAKWGHTPVIAHNGKQVLSLLETEKFDVVLMDLQMPEINGFEATATIREKERATGIHIPIIALTAHALKGDRERCIDAGMDEYVAKPIEAQRLFEVIEAAVRHSEQTSNNGRLHPSEFDVDAVLKNFDGDVELVRKLVDVFADSSGVQLSGIRDAIERGDCQTVEFASHSLKGAVANFRAQAAADAAARLEQMGRGKDLSDAYAAFDILETEIERLKRELAKFLEVNV